MAFITLSMFPLISYHGVPTSTSLFSLPTLPTPVSFHLTHLLTHINSWAPCSTLLALFLRSSYLKIITYMKLYISVYMHTPTTASSLCSFPLPHRGWQTPNSLFSPLPGLPSLPLHLWLLNIPLSNNPPAISASTVDFNHDNPLKQSCGSEQLLQFDPKVVSRSWETLVCPISLMGEQEPRVTLILPAPACRSWGALGKGRDGLAAKQTDPRKQEYSFCRFSQYTLFPP